MVLVRCWSRILMALLLSSKRCALHARRLRRFPAPATDEEHAHVSFLLQASPGRQPTAVGEVLICAKASARLLRNALPGGTMGHEVHLLPFTSLYSSLQGADQYSREGITQRPQGGVTKGSFPLTIGSQNADGTGSLSSRTGPCGLTTSHFSCSRESR